MSDDNDFNERNIAEFRANHGRVSGPFEGAPIVLETREVRVTFSDLGGVVKEWMVLHDPVKGRVMNQLLYTSHEPGLGMIETNFQRGSTVVLPPRSFRIPLPKRPTRRR